MSPRAAQIRERTRRHKLAVELMRTKGISLEEAKALVKDYKFPEKPPSTGIES